MKKWLIGFFMLTIMIGVPGAIGTWDQAEAQHMVLQSLSKPMPVPDFSLENLQGKEVNIQEYLGKVLLLNFWATW